MKKTFANRIKNMIMKMMLNCRQATLLVDKQGYIELSSKERIDLKLHLTTCKYCRVYNNQNKIINQMLAKSFKVDEQKLKLSKEQKNKMIEKLDLKS